jgi:hypothetical protein
MLNLWSSSDAKEDTEDLLVVAGEAIPLRAPVVLIEARTVLPPFIVGLGRGAALTGVRGRYI